MGFSCRCRGGDSRPGRTGKPTTRPETHPTRRARVWVKLFAPNGVGTGRSGAKRLSVSRIGLALLAIVAAVSGAFVLFRAYDERSAPPIVIEDAAATLPVVVDVRGAVAKPGVYELPPGARVQDAVSAAGGLAQSADLSTVNLARRLRDGEQLVIAALPTAGGAMASPVGLNGNATMQGRLNINTATAAELDALPGIGEVIAQRIVDFRTEHGPYRSVDDLIHVQGISARTIAGLRDLVTTAP